MILQALNQYYEDLVAQGNIAKPGWLKTKVNYALCINEQGELQQVIPLLEETDGKKPQPQQMDLPSAVVRHGKVLKANFLWDNSTYMLGIDEEKGKSQEECLERFRTCAELYRQILDGVESSVAHALLNYFSCWEPLDALNHPALTNDYKTLTSGANMVFRVNSTFAHEDFSVREAWQRYYDADENRDEYRQCLITGNKDFIMQIHPPIRGIGTKAESALVSFNCDAFCSYGKKQNYNAPVGKSAAFAYTSALNYLLGYKENVQHIGDASVVCWAEGGEEQYQSFSYAALFGQKNDSFSEGDLRDAVKKLAEGKPVPEWDLVPDRKFYILGISPNAARLSIRFFYQDSFGNLMRNINAHHERMEIVHGPKEHNIVSIWGMLKETINPKSTDKTPNPVMAGSVIRAIFTGGLYPAALLEQVMMRIRAERNVTRGRAAIIKAFYLRNPNKDCSKEVLTVALNEESTNPAYVLGRLFSIYEAIQSAANPGINTTIKDKYFNSASSTPAMIFPLLDNLVQKHLRKLDTGKRIWYEKQIMDVTGMLNEFPSRLSLPQQGAFDLGYYHQTQKRYEKKEDK